MSARDPYRIVSNIQDAIKLFQDATGNSMAMARDYWTLERLANARPLSMAIDSAAARQERLSHDLLVQAFSEPMPPDIAFVPPLPPPTFKTDPVGGAVLRQSPYSVVGKLFGKFGSDYTATAFVIGERTVLTAAHCVFDGNAGFATNLRFAAQLDGTASAGAWQLPIIATLGGWIDFNSDDDRFDMAIAISDKPIRPITGKAGVATPSSLPSGSLITSLGYPRTALPGYPFDGKKMWECDGSYITTAGDIVVMSNNLTDGSSGGPWFLKGGPLQAIGLNSRRLTEETERLHSPVFGGGMHNLIQWMKDHGGDA